MIGKVLLLALIAVASSVQWTPTLRNCHVTPCRIPYDQPIEVDMFLGDDRKMSIECGDTNDIGRFVQVEFWARKDELEVLKFVGRKTKTRNRGGPAVKMDAKQFFHGQDFSPPDPNVFGGWSQEINGDSMRWDFDFYENGEAWEVSSFRPAVYPVVYAYFTHLKITANGNGSCSLLVGQLNRGTFRKPEKRPEITDDVYWQLKDRFCNPLVPKSLSSADWCVKTVKTTTPTLTTTTSTSSTTATSSSTSTLTSESTTSSSSTTTPSTPSTSSTSTSASPTSSASRTTTSDGIEDILNSMNSTSVDDVSTMENNTSLERVTNSTPADVSTEIPMTTTTSGPGVGFDKRWQLIVFGNAGILAIPSVVLIVLIFKGVVIVRPEKQLSNGEALDFKMEKRRNDCIMSTPLPVPVFYDQPNPLSTKREMLAKTPNRCSLSLPRTAKSFRPHGPINSRVNELNTRRPVFISFKEGEDALWQYLPQSEIYDPTLSDPYFDQCFIIDMLVGAGSFGEVFAVRSKDTLRPYAIKRTKIPFRTSMDRKQKLREVEKHQTVDSHPNLVLFVRAWEERGLLYIQTELCDKSLDQLAKESSPDFTVPEATIWSYCHDLLQAVDYLHERNLIHVDIKPANIFITKSGTCKLGDFGLMMDLTKDEMSNAEEGDSKYLDLEVLNGVPSKASDIFSLGITILELASGLYLPAYGPGWEMLRNKQIPEEYFTDLSADLVSMITRMMDSDPAARPTARELLDHPRFCEMRADRQAALSAADSYKSPEYNCRNAKRLADTVLQYAATLPTKMRRLRACKPNKKVGRLDFSKVDF